MMVVLVLDDDLFFQRRLTVADAQDVEKRSLGAELM